MDIVGEVSSRKVRSGFMRRKVTICKRGLRGSLGQDRGSDSCSIGSPIFLYGVLISIEMINYLFFDCSLIVLLILHEWEYAV